MSYHRQGFPKLAVGINPGDALVDSRGPQHRLGSPTMRVTRPGVIHNLPTIHQAIGGTTNELEAKVKCISAKAFKWAIRKRRIKKDIVFLGLIQKVQEPTEQVDVAKKYKGKSDLGAIHVWRGDMSKCIKAVLKEYNDIFP